MKLIELIFCGRNIDTMLVRKLPKGSDMFQFNVNYITSMTKKNLIFGILMVERLRPRACVIKLITAVIYRHITVKAHVSVIKL